MITSIKHIILQKPQKMILRVQLIADDVSVLQRVFLHWFMLFYYQNCLWLVSLVDCPVRAFCNEIIVCIVKYLHFPFHLSKYPTSIFQPKSHKSHNRHYILFPSKSGYNGNGSATTTGKVFSCDSFFSVFQHIALASEGIVIFIA